MFDIDYALSATQIALMSQAEFGAWMRLHLRANREQHGGTLPDSDRELAYFAGFSGRQAVEDWREIKPEVMKDWVLCSDGRWHHPMRAKNVLHIWIARRETDRKSAIGNGAKSAEVRAGVRAIEADIELGASALRDLDSRDLFLLKLDARMSKWQRPEQAVVEDRATGDDTPGGVTAAVRAAENTCVGGPKQSEAKQSEDSSSPRRGDASPDHENLLGTEIEEVGRSAKRTPGRSAGQERAPPWPAGWFEMFKAHYPRKEAWGRAEKVLERIRKAGRVPFEEILAGIERYVARGLTAEYTRLPATWLNDRGWEDQPAPPSVGRSFGGRVDRATTGVDSAVAGLDVVFARRRAPPLTSLGEIP